MEQDTQTRRPIATSKLVFGLGLIAIGVAAFLGAIDVWHVRNLWKLWPLFLIAIGVGSEIDALQHRKGDGGYILIAIGCWFLVGSFHLFALSIGEAMPISVTVAGLGLVFHALLDRPSAGKENDNVC